MVLFSRVNLPLKHYLSTSFSLGHCRHLYTCDATERKVFHHSSVFLGESFFNFRSRNRTFLPPQIILMLLPRYLVPHGMLKAITFCLYWICVNI